MDGQSEDEDGEENTLSVLYNFVNLEGFFVFGHRYCITSWTILIKELGVARSSGFYYSL